MPTFLVRFAYNQPNKRNEAKQYAVKNQQSRVLKLQERLKSSGKEKDNRRMLREELPYHCVGEEGVTVGSPGRGGSGIWLLLKTLISLGLPRSPFRSDSSKAQLIRRYWSNYNYNYICWCEVNGIPETQGEKHSDEQKLLKKKMNWSVSAFKNNWSIDRVFIMMFIYI